MRKVTWYSRPKRNWKINPLQLKGTYNNLPDYFKDDFADKNYKEKVLRTFSKENDLSCYGTLNAIIDLDNVPPRNDGLQKNQSIWNILWNKSFSCFISTGNPERVRTATLKGLVPYDLVISFDFCGRGTKKFRHLVITDCKETRHVMLLIQT